MVRRRDRIIALVIAIAFFGTSFALSFGVIWQLYQDNKKAKTVDESTTQNDQPKQVLKGTKLAGFTPIAKVEKLERLEQKAGNGAEVKPDASVTVDYTGAFAATGEIFESSLDSGQPASFALNQVIEGWTEGIPGAKVGGTYRLLIPASKAYEGVSGRPQGDLVFDITIHETK